MNQLRQKTGGLCVILLLCLMCTSWTAFGQTKQTVSISGVVLDENNDPLPGASIIVKGTRIGVTSNATGEFSLNNVPSNSTLTVTMLGYHENSTPLDGRTRFTIKMQNDVISLEDVVIMPYSGAVSRRDLTGSVTSVNISDMNKQTAISFETAIAGKIAGVEINTGDGQPGALSSIIIRGANSVTQNNSPLYVIDGVPMVDTDDANMPRIDNSSIPTQNIKSIEILKDASATAIYGSRGANGVIVITTKEGEKGTPKLSFNATYTLMHDYNRPEVMSPYEFVKLQNELDSSYGSMYLSGREKANGTTWTLDDYRNVTPYDWQELVSRQGSTQNYGISLSGGSDRTTYMTSFDYTKQVGMFQNTDMQNYVANFSLTQKLSDKMSLNLRAGFAEKEYSGLQVNSGQGSGAFMFKVWSYRPLDVNGIDLTHELLDPEALDENGNFKIGFARYNPIIELNNTDKTYINRKLNGSAQFTYKILPSLTFNLSLAYTSIGTEDNQFNNNSTQQGSNLPGQLNGINGYRRFVKIHDLLNENTLNYRKVFAKDHDLSVTVGATQQKHQTDIFQANAIQVDESAQQYGIYSLNTGQSFTIPSSALNTWSMTSFLGRVAYNYKRKYYLTASYRADGSSKFAKDNQWGYFPSGGLSWRFTEEPLVKPVKWLSEGKLSVSYGVTGNNNVGEYAWQPKITLASSGTPYYYAFNDGTPIAGAIVSGIENLDLKWETTYTFNSRLEFGLFKNRVNFITEVYRKQTKDLLLNANLPAHTGYKTAQRNVGKVENKGLEITVSAIPINNNNNKFRWTSTFNIAFNRNKVLALTNDQIVLPADIKYNGSGTPLYIAKVGQPIGMIYGAISDGLYTYDDFYKAGDNTWILKQGITAMTTSRTAAIPGYEKFRDLNNDLQINADDMTIIGNPNPDFKGGFTNNIEWRNWDLQIFFDFSYGNDVLNYNRYIMESGQSNSSNQWASYADRWTVDNPEGKLPRVRSSIQVSWASSRLVEDGSYLRLRNLNLGYTIPSVITQKFYVSNLRLSVAAQNLFTWTNYSGQDPTISTLPSARTPGYDYSAYPVPKLFIFKLSATF